MGLTRLLPPVLAIGAIALVVTAPTGAAVQRPALEAVLGRAGAYVANYLDVLSKVVAEEEYVQDVSGRRPALSREMEKAFGASAPRASHREFRSDLMLVNIGPPMGWLGYRDVFEVDGKPVRDRDDRVAKLMLQPSATAREQAERIADEGARFNISAIGRTLNQPGLPLVFLQTALQPRFRFSLDERDARVGPNVWIVKYEETVRPSLFRHNYTNENPSSGRFWIDVLTGDVLQTENVLSPPGVTATFTTTFRRDERFGVAVPVEMRERVVETSVANGQRLQGTATYSNFRKFDVKTEEKIR